MTIAPDVGHTVTMTGSSTSGLIVLNGASWVIVDGNNGGVMRPSQPAVATRNVTLTNTSVGTSSAVIWLQTNGTNNPAANNTIKNMNLVGSGNLQTLIGVGSGSSTISVTSTGTGNNNNTYQNNNISATQYGIYSGGASATNRNTGTVITQNAINTASPNNVGKGGIFVKFDNGPQITKILSRGSSSRVHSARVPTVSH